MRIRSEQPGDVSAVREVNLGAFETQTEADLVEVLRTQASPLLSLVAEENATVIGHLMCSPAICDQAPDLRIMGLAPMAVRKEHQRQGVGSRLVERAIELCRDLPADAIIVLGHPGYYPRFGFRPGSDFGFRSVYDVPDEVFMAMELREGALGDARGIVQYHPAFDSMA